MTDRKALMLAGAAQAIAARLAIETGCEVSFDHTSAAEQTIYLISEPAPCREVREHWEPMRWTHPTSPKPTKNRRQIKRARKQNRKRK